MLDFTNSVVLQAVTRLLLRMIPFVPGPELAALLDAVSRSRSEIDRKIERAYESMRESVALIGELQRDLETRVAQVGQLKEEYDRYSQLAKIEEREARALIGQLERTVERGKGKERLVALLINLVAGVIIFLFGIWLGPLITGWLSPPVTSTSLPSVTTPLPNGSASVR